MIENQIQIEEVEAPIESFNDAMGDMIKALITKCVPAYTKKGHSRVQNPKEQFISHACKAPLYEGENFSKLRVVLSILNLEATFGWSDASVSASF